MRFRNPYRAVTIATICDTFKAINPRRVGVPPRKADVLGFTRPLDPDAL